MDQGPSFDLKMCKASMEDIQRGDLVFKNGSIWMCVSKTTNTFANMENKQKIQITDQNILKLAKLQLIPIKWEVIDSNIYLEGRQLGMGPNHKLSISWLRQFQEMQMIAKAKQHGRDLRNKVILCETTKDKRFVIVGIELL